MGGRPDAVIYIRIDPGGKEGTLTNDLQWRVWYDQGINDHDQQYRRKNGKSNHEPTGAKDLLKGMLHGGISPQSSDCAALMRGSMKP